MSQSNSSEGNFKDIALLIGGLVYFVAPVDVIPDFIAGVGFTDDLAALTLVFKSAYSLFKSSDIAKANETAAKLLGDHFDAEKAAKMTQQILAARKK